MESRLSMKWARGMYTIDQKMVWDWMIPKSILPWMWCSDVPVGHVGVVRGRRRALPRRHVGTQNALLAPLLFATIALLNMSQSSKF
jgi:hypothetical protein